MNRSKPAVTLFVAVLSMLTVPVLAQSTGSTSSPGTTSPSPRSASEPDPLVPSTRPGSPASSGSVNSTIRSSPNSTSATGRNNEIQTGAQTNARFDQIDLDRDGRLSLAEYTRSSAVTNSSRSSGTSSVTPGAVATESRSGVSTSGTADARSATNSAEVFRQLDRDHDGYLSRDELDAARGNRPGGTVP